jgi:predicted alpha/beta-hydrolase family hydrolase
VHEVPTPAGPARVHLSPASAPLATLVLGHGAGGGVEAADLAALAAGLPARRVSVVRVEQPWRVAGRRVATPPASLDSAWLAVLGALDVAGPLVVGGRSAGARVACRTARGLGARGCVALAFPLHPPGRPERSRLAELTAAGVPTLVVQGERDAFGGPAEFPEGVDVRQVPGADHSLRVPAGQDRAEVIARVVVTVGDWVLELVGNRVGRPAVEPE